MAEIVKTVKIETGSGERSVKSLKKEISDLRDALLNMDKGGEEWKKTADELTKAQEDLNSVMKAGKEAADADATSIAGMEARYKSLYSTYKMLSDEQRKTAKGISMQKELAELSKNLNSTKKDAGNFKDNIGHYADDMMSAFGQLGISVGSLQGPLKMATNGSNLLKKAWDTLKAHPILAVLAILIGLFNKVKDAIAGNEELQLRMNNVMAAFKPIGDAVAGILDTIAHVAVSVAEGIAKAVEWVNNLFGATKKLNDIEKDAAKTENELITKRREYQSLNANDEARIKSLIEEAGLTDNAIEKQQKLTEAKELQEQVNKRNVELAEKEYELLQKQSEARPNSIEDNDRLNAAKIAVDQARANGSTAMRRINNQLNSANNAVSSAANNAVSSAANNAKNELDSVLKRLEENSKTAIEKRKAQYEKELELLKKHHKDTKALTQEYEKDIQALRVDQWRKNQEENEKILATMPTPSTAVFETRREMLQMYRMNANTAKINYRNIDPNDKETIRAYEIEVEQLTAQLKDLDNEQREWENSIANTRAELDLFIKTYEENAAADLLLGDTDVEAATMGAANAAQRDFLKERAENLKVAYDEIKDLDEAQLNDKRLTLNDQLDAEREYYEALEALRQHDLQNQLMIREREKELEQDKIDALHELKMTSLDSMNSIIETTKTLIDAYKKDGEISEKEAKRKAKTMQWLEGIQGAVAVAGIVADTASGWMAINRALAQEYILNAQTAAATGPAAVATKAALDAKSLITANIRKAVLLVNGTTAAAAAVGKTIANIKALGADTGDGGTGGAGSATATPALIESTPYSYTRELQTNIEREEMLNTPIYVRVTDIDAAQARVKVTSNETTF